MLQVCICTQQNHILSVSDWETRQGFPTTKEYLPLVAPVFIWNQEVQTTQQKILSGNWDKNHHL